MFKDGCTPDQEYARQTLYMTMASAILVEARSLAGAFGKVEDYFDAALRNLEKAQVYVKDRNEF